MASSKIRLLRRASTRVGVQTPHQPANLTTLSFGDLNWVDITDPTVDSKAYLAEHYNFHPLDLDDCFSSRQLSKVDEYQSYIFVLLHLPLYLKAKRRSTTMQWSVFVGENYLVTLHPSQLAGIDEIVRECQASEETKKEYMSRGPGYLMYTILDRVVDAYFPVLDNILGKMENLEESVFDEGVEAGKEISIMRRDILTQRRVMFPMRRLLAELENKLKRFATMDMTVYYGDLMDHMNKICDTLDECRDTIEVFKDTDYVLSDYRANTLVRTIAIMLAIGIPFAVAASIYLLLPDTVNKSDLWLFAVFMVASLVAVGCALYVLRRKSLL